MNCSQLTTQRWGIICCLSLVFSCSAFAAPIFSVNSTSDANDDVPGDGVCHTPAGTCTLRAAISEANRVAGSDVTINLPAGTYILQILPSASDDEFSGDLNLAAPVSGSPLIMLVGAGATTTIIDANHIDRVMHVALSRRASIHGVTLRGGTSMSGGAGVFNAGTLAIDQSRIMDNTALEDAGGGIINTGSLTLNRVGISQNKAALGAGIYNERALAIDDSSIFDNQASLYGGGIYTLDPAANAKITTSTISHNQAGSGGGILSSANLMVVNSTVAYNHAQQEGGGISAYAEANKFVYIYSSTIAFNAAYNNDGSDGAGGGIYLNNGYVAVIRSLLVGNYDSGSPASSEDCHTANGGVFQFFGANLITQLGAACAFQATVSSLNYLNSLDFLGPLKANGGPTQTIALLSGSNAIDAASFCDDSMGHPLQTDQRGFERSVGSACDIGAYELDPNRIFTDGFE